MTRHTHSDRLERWLGTEEVERLSHAMKDWYGPPISVRGVPGAVKVAKGGDFLGPIDGGGASNLATFLDQRFRRVVRNVARRSAYTAGMGFSSLGDLISEATNGGKRRKFTYSKVGTTGVAGNTNSLWRVGTMPTAAPAASAAPGGQAPTRLFQGAFSFANPTAPDTLHLVRWDNTANVGGNTLLMYDRIFQVAKLMNSTATELVTGVPTRYQSTTAGANDSAEGNFLFMEVGTTLPAAAHNWTVCTYTDQSGAGKTLPSVTGVSSAAQNRLDMPAQTWFAPLAAGDTGVRTLTQMQCSALVATGTVDFVIGHPLTWMPANVANYMAMVNLVTDAFSLERIFDDAAVAFLEVNKSAVTATTYTGTFEAVSG